MKNKSTFAQVIVVIIVAVVCIVATMTIALVAGSSDANLFDLRNLNLANMLPVLLIGGFLTCVIVGIAVLCVSRSVFFKVKEYLENSNNGGEEK